MAKCDFVFFWMPFSSLIEVHLCSPVLWIKMEFFMGRGACCHGWAPLHLSALYLEGEECRAFVNSINWVARVLPLVLLKVRFQTCPWRGAGSRWIMDTVSLGKSVHWEGYIFSGDIRVSVMSIISIRRDNIRTYYMIHFMKIQIKTRPFDATALVMI